MNLTRLYNQRPLVLKDLEMNTVVARLPHWISRSVKEGSSGLSCLLQAALPLAEAPACSLRHVGEKLSTKAEDSPTRAVDESPVKSQQQADLYPATDPQFRNVSFHHPILYITKPNRQSPTSISLP